MFECAVISIPWKMTLEEYGKPCVSTSIILLCRPPGFSENRCRPRTRHVASPVKPRRQQLYGEKNKTVSQRLIPCNKCTAVECIAAIIDLWFTRGREKLTVYTYLPDMIMHAVVDSFAWKMYTAMTRVAQYILYTYGIHYNIHVGIHRN